MPLAVLHLLPGSVTLLAATMLQYLVNMDLLQDIPVSPQTRQTLAEIFLLHSIAQVLPVIIVLELANKAKPQQITAASLDITQSTEHAMGLLLENIIILLSV